MSEPYHAGQFAVQQRAGERAQAVMNGEIIAPAVARGAQAFIAQQRHCVLGHTAAGGGLRASFLPGETGFAATDAAGTTLRLDLGASPLAADLAAMGEGDPVGVLFIDFATRRRFRVNGSVAAATTATRLLLHVGEAFPNCPKYIQRRSPGPRLADAATGQSGAAASAGVSLEGDLLAWIAAADTFFVASAAPDGRIDVSHRGGNPGFVRFEGGALVVPDYPGNSMFKTLGNFAVDPRAALAFVDFQGRRQLRLKGSVRLHLDGADPEGRTGGTGRQWFFTPEEWNVTPLPALPAWALLDRSPYNP